MVIKALYNNLMLGIPKRKKEKKKHYGRREKRGKGKKVWGEGLKKNQKKPEN